MKHLVLLLLLLLPSCIIDAQYVKQREGEKWGVNEYKYLELGNKMEEYISQNMYNSAIECLAEMFSLECTNANREKDMYASIHCTLQLEEYDTVIGLADEYEKAFPDSPRLYSILGNKGFAYAVGKKDYRNAISSLEKALLLVPSSDYSKRSLYCEYIGESYFLLKNNFLSRQFYKKAILYFLKLENVSITSIETSGINSPHLGQLFLDYRSPYIDDYNVFMYLNYLAVKCNNPKAREDYSYLLEDSSYLIYKSKVPSDLFSE